MHTAADREHKLQRHRLRMTLLSVANTSLQSAVIALFAWAGEVAWSVAWQFLLLGAGSSALFALVIWRGWNLRLKDPAGLLSIRSGGVCPWPRYWLLRGAGSNIVWVRLHTLQVSPWNFVTCATSSPSHAS